MSIDEPDKPDGAGGTGTCTAHQTVCIGSTTWELMRCRPFAATHRPSATQAKTPDRSSSSSAMVYAPYAASTVSVICAAVQLGQDWGKMAL